MRKETGKCKDLTETLRLGRTYRFNQKPYLYAFQEKGEPVFYEPDSKEYVVFSGLRPEDVQEGEFSGNPDRSRLGSALSYASWSREVTAYGWDVVEQWRRNEDLLMGLDLISKAIGVLVGRVIREPIADGFAVYQIVRENKKSVRIVHVSGIGDDYMLPSWGEEATIPKDYASKNIWRRDFWEIFRKSQKNSQ